MKKPLSYSGTRARHSASSTKSAYCFSVRSQPVPFTRRRLPFVTEKVTSYTGTQPVRSLPLNSDSQWPSLAASVATQGWMKAKHASRIAGNSFNRIVFIRGLGLPGGSALQVEGFEFGAGGKGPLRLIARGGLADYPDSEHFDWAGQPASEALPAFEAGRIGGGSGGVVLKFPDGLPLGVWGGLDLDARFACAGVEPTAVVERLTMGKYDASNADRLIQGHSIPILRGKLVVKGHYEALEVLVNNRAADVPDAGTRLLTVKQYVAAGRRQAQWEPHFVWGSGRPCVGKGDQADVHRCARLEALDALAGDCVDTKDLGTGPGFDRSRSGLRREVQRRKVRPSRRDRTQAPIGPSQQRVIGRQYQGAVEDCDFALVLVIAHDHARLQLEPELDLIALLPYSRDRGVTISPVYRRYRRAVHLH